MSESSGMDLRKSTDTFSDPRPDGLSSGQEAVQILPRGSLDRDHHDAHRAISIAMRVTKKKNTEPKRGGDLPSLASVVCPARRTAPLTRRPVR
jgi:hypothetical protein